MNNTNNAQYIPVHATLVEGVSAKTGNPYRFYRLTATVAGIEVELTTKDRTASALLAMVLDREEKKGE